jgi:cyclic-di-AMP phosphodiesterase PgpH
MTRKAIINTVILALTMVIVAAILVVGTDTGAEVPPHLAVGQPSPQDFVADRSTDPIEDIDETNRLRQLARDNVEVQYTVDNDATLSVVRNVNTFFTDLREGAVGVAPVTTTTLPPETTTSVTEPGSSTTVPGTTVPEATTTTVAPRRPIEEQVALLELKHSTLALSIPSFVSLYNNDLDRVAAGEAEATFPAIEERTLELLHDELEAGIKPGDLTQRQQVYLTEADRPAIFILGLPDEEQETARTAIAQLVGFSLQANLRADEEKTNRARDLAAAAVDPQYVTYSAGDTIVEEGESINSVQFTAIQQLKLYEPEVIPGASRWAMALLGAMAVLLAAFFLWRIAPTQWTEPRHMALLSILLILAALFSRIPDLVAQDSHALGFIMPAVAIGFIAAILFDPRTAVLMAIPMAGFTAISTLDLSFTVYAAIATVIPVAFVSRVSSRRQLRVAVLLTAITVAPVAAAVEWLFSDGSPGLAALWAFIGALVAGLVSLGLVSFLENAFGMTTTLGLLDLLDRNHPALRLIEEQAPGTFNHSMLVGALAGRAARAIDADPLLAQAAAWYHDLGKTQHPQYFVENQFGVSNPHDSLAPAESAQIIRSHVTDGLKLAKRYRIPRDVADGIRMHHGTSLMRYFYNKAVEADPNVDPARFRHFGVKPQAKEMAIVMLSDATEAAARAYSQEEDPTAEGLQRVVDTVVAEKVDDGQLDDSALTFGDLTAIKAELVLALMGYYHARVPYPGFPGPKPVEDTERPKGLPGVTVPAAREVGE